MFRIFRVLTSEMLGRLVPVFTLLLCQCDKVNISVVDTVEVIVMWRRQEYGRVNTGVRYLTVCLITEIYQDRSFSFHDAHADNSK